MNGYCCKENKLSMDLLEKTLILEPFVFIFEKIKNDVLHYVFQIDDIQQKMELEPCQKDIEAGSFVSNDSNFVVVAGDTYYNIPCLDSKINLVGLLNLLEVEKN